MKKGRLDIIQRVVYASILIIEIISIFSRPVSYFFQQSSIGLTYWIVYLVAIIPFVYQLIFNNKIGWIILICLALLDSTLSFIDAYKKDIELSNLILFFLVYLILIGGVLYLMKPRTKY